MKSKKDILASVVGLPMFAALLIGSGYPTPGINPATYWTVEAICLAVIVAGALVIRKIYKSTNQ